jgi:uncharacterized protein
MLRSLTAPEAQACLTVTLLDGLVIARSGFHSSMNYRSVLLLGRPRLVEDEDEKVRALDAIVDHVAPGRSGELRPHTRVELRQTTVLALPVAEGSAKVRTGGPVDDPDDLSLPLWAGVVPLRIVADAPEPAPDLADGIPAPDYLLDYRRPGPGPR